MIMIPKKIFISYLLKYLQYTIHLRAFFVKTKNASCKILQNKRRMKFQHILSKTNLCTTQRMFDLNIIFIQRPSFLIKKISNLLLIIWSHQIV